MELWPWSPPPGSQKSLLRGSVAVSFTLTYKLNKKVRRLCWQGRAPHSCRAWVSVAGAYPEQGLWQFQPLLWPELSPKAVGQEDALLAPLGPVPHQPPTSTACLKANQSMPQAGKRQTDT